MPYADIEKRREANRKASIKYAANNREKRLESGKISGRKWRAKNQEYAKTYYQENKEKHQEDAKTRYYENKDERQEYARKYVQENKEMVAEKRKKYFELPENKAKRRKSRQKYYYENKEQIRKKGDEWWAANPERVSENRKKWNAANPAKNRFYSMNRLAAKLNATPAWLTNKQKKEIAKIYKEAVAMEKRTGMKYHVDHIVPLQGKNVSGLHVPWNLQVLTATENVTKGNRLQEVNL